MDTGSEITVDLEARHDHRARTGAPSRSRSTRRPGHRLLNGLDEIGLTLEHESEIAAYEAAHSARVATTAIP